MHHKTYKRFGAERLTDLLPLCSKHHAMTHKVVREARAAGTSVSTINYWNAAKRVKRQQKGK
jgi:predicted HNH restriction endonuclease